MEIQDALPSILKSIQDQVEARAQKPRAEVRIVVGMSGGVDSSVTAALLKKAGFEVIGLFMKNWDEKDERGECLASREYLDVVAVCERLEIPYYSVELVSTYWDRVFQDFIDDHKKGLTPNPDVLCNQNIKFDAFFEKAREYGADFLATGHYCQLSTDPEAPALLRGLDEDKDQSYFLQNVSTDILKHVLFPIGGLKKSRVRDLARYWGISTAEKKDSTGICFIGERKFRPFLQQFLKRKPGAFKTLNGERVGTHEGAQFYTLGQRRGLGLGGEGDRWYVVKKDILKNEVYVERGENHPALFSSELTAIEPKWVKSEPKELKAVSDESFGGSGGVGGEVGKSGALRVTAKVRYRQKDQACSVTYSEDRKTLNVRFDSPQRAITPGQYVAFYNGDECLGGARIVT